MGRNTRQYSSSLSLLKIFIEQVYRAYPVLPHYCSLFSTLLLCLAVTTQLVHPMHDCLARRVACKDVQLSWVVFITVCVDIFPLCVDQCMFQLSGYIEFCPTSL